MQSISTAEPMSFHAVSQSMESKASSESDSQPYGKTELTKAVEGTSQEQRRTAFPKERGTMVTA